MISPDQTLPHLATVVDANAMAWHFDGYIRRCCPDIAWEVDGCAVEKIYYRPARYCGVLYRLHLRHPSGALVDEWFFGRTYPPGSGWQQYEKAAARVRCTHAVHECFTSMPPVSFWTDLNMILWIFPQDPKLATLPYMALPRWVRQHVNVNLEVLHAVADATDVSSPSWHCHSTHYDRIKYMPGKRCVLRHHVHVSGPCGSSQAFGFFSKTYKDATSRAHFTYLKTAYECLQAQAAGVHIPRPLVYLDGYHTFWQEDWGGQGLLEVMDDLDWDALFPQLAAGVAALHRSQIADLPGGPDLDDILQTAIEDGTRLSALWPTYQSSVQRLIQRLTAEKTKLQDQQWPVVPTHGAMRIEQFVAREQQLALIDFDAISYGDPLLDVAEFLVSLQYQECTRGQSRARLQQAAGRFLDAYRRHVAWDCTPQRIAWYALAFLLGKMFLSVKNLDRPALVHLDTAGQDLMNHWLAWLE